MSAQAAIVLGASGSVGQALLAEVLRSHRFSRVFVMTRRPLALAAGAHVEQRIVADMKPENLYQAVVDVLGECSTQAVGFSVLGIGAGTAKLTLDEHRAVDVDLNAAFARGLRDSGRVEHLCFMSAIGADITARTTGSGAAGMPRYARVKGESEEAVVRHGPPVVSIFRPGVIIGSQHTPRVLAAVLPLLAPITPSKFRPIRTTQIARAMVAVGLRPGTKSAIYHYPEMIALNALG